VEALRAIKADDNSLKLQMSFTKKAENTARHQQ